MDPSLENLTDYEKDQGVDKRKSQIEWDVMMA